ERRYLARAAFLQQHRRLGDPAEATDARTDHRAGGATLLFRRWVPIGVIQRLARRGHGKNDEVIDFALVLRLHPLVGIEGAVAAVAARHLAGDLAGEIGDIEGRNLPRATLAVEDALPGGLD